MIKEEFFEGWHGDFKFRAKLRFSYVGGINRLGGWSIGIDDPNDGADYSTVTRSLSASYDKQNQITDPNYIELLEQARRAVRDKA